jgi:hypothetical protein
MRQSNFQSQRNEANGGNRGHAAACLIKYSCYAAAVRMALRSTSVGP